jgi:serine/threonine protein kinase
MPGWVFKERKNNMGTENNAQDGSLPLTMAIRIDEVCDRFEAAWQSGPAPRLEDYLGATEGPERDELLRQLLRVDLEFRHKNGGVPPIEEYLGRFPGYERLIREEVEREAALPRKQPQPEAGRETVSFAGGVTTMPAIHKPEAEGTIPGYEIHRQLGRGMMGIVYEAVQVKAGRPVALKVIRGGADAQPEELDRFRHEAESAASLQHPNIAQIFEVGEHNGLPFFSMELCRAGSLDHYLQAGPLPAAEAAALVETLARAMHHAHKAVIIHRDLKPANIMLSPADAVDGAARTAVVPDEGNRLPLSSLVPKVGDFGLARKLDTGGQTQPGAILGTPSYMAPEQALGRNKELGPACDIYALGAILYECLTGRPPFKAATVLDTVLQVISDEPVPPAQLNPRVPRDLETICLHCLRKDPGKRYASAAALADDLGAFQRGEPITARPVGHLERGWRWGKRNPALAAALAAVLLVFATGATISSILFVVADRRAEEAIKSEAKLAKSNDKLLKSAARLALRPLALQAQPNQPVPPLSGPEIESVWEVASSEDGRFGVLFVEEALRNPVSTRQLKDRAAVALHAAVGLDGRRRRQVEELLAKCLQTKEITQEQQVNVALCLADLGGVDRPLAGRTAAILTQAMSKTTDEYALQYLSQGLSAVATRMEPSEAAATLTQAMSKAMNNPRDLKVLTQGLSGSAAHLEPEEAAEVAARLTRTMSNTADWSTVPVQCLSESLSAVAIRMKPKEGAATLTEGMIQALSKPSDTTVWQFLSQGLSAVATRLEPKEAAEVAATLTQALIRARSQGKLGGIPQFSQALAAVASRMEPKEAVTTLTEAISKSNLNEVRPLSQGLLAVAARLEPGDAATVLIRAMNKTTNPFSDLPDLSQGLCEVALRLDPREAAATLLQAMRQTTNSYDLWYLSRGLSTVATRMKPREATETLTQAIKMTTHPLALGALLEGLSAVATRMEAKEAVETCGQAAAILITTIRKTGEPSELAALSRSLSSGVVDRMKPAEAVEVALKLNWARSQRADSITMSSIEHGLTAVKKRVGPKEAADIAATLVQAMNETTDPSKWEVLKSRLSTVAAHMEPRSASDIATKLTQAMSQTKDPSVLDVLSRSLSAVAAHMEPTSASDIATKLTQVMSQTKDPSVLVALAESLSAVAACMKPNQAAQTWVQAIKTTTDPGVLELLLQRLSGVAAVMEPMGVAWGQTTVVLIEAIGKPMGRDTLQSLSRGFSAVAARMEPKEAAELAARLTQAMSQTTDPDVLGALSVGLSAVTVRMVPKEAVATLTQASNKMTANRMTNARALRVLAQALSAVAARMEPKEATATLTEAMNKPNIETSTLQDLSTGLSAVALRMKAKEGVATLTQAMKHTPDLDGAAFWSLAQGLSALATRLDPKEAADLATTLTQAMSGRGAEVRHDGLSLVLLNLTPHMEPREAVATLTKAIGVSGSGLGLAKGFLTLALCRVAIRLQPAEAADALKLFMTDRSSWISLPLQLEGLSLVAARMDVKEAGEAAVSLIEMMSKGFDLSKGLSAVLSREGSHSTVPFGGLDAIEFAVTNAGFRGRSIGIANPTRRRTLHVTATVGVLRGPGMPVAALACLQPALEPPPPPLPAQTLVDLLKHPLCVGEARRLVLNQLARHYDRLFADQWEFVEYAHKQKLDLDLTTPPQRSDTAVVGPR